MHIGVDTLPVLPTDPGDRNRTSPFAFTGNRFEFRAPGSMQTVAGPMTTINTIMADSLDYCATELEAAIASGTDFDVAVQTLLTEIITDHGDVVFNGDGYSSEWPIEAEQRGLANLKTTLDALPELITEPAMELFERYGVFNHREMHSRYEIGLEQYALTISVEARLMNEIGTTAILPAAVKHQTATALNIGALKAAGVEPDLEPLHEISVPLAALRAGLVALRAAINTDVGHSALAEATHAREALLPAMADVRAAADALEEVVADELWPLPTYQEMLFIL
jgi:glutamine synthetase